MSRNGHVAGSAALSLVDGVSLLHPEDQVFEAMLTGWRNQQMARNLAPRRWTAVSIRCARSREVQAGIRGSGARIWLMNGSATCAGCGTVAGRQCAAIRRRSVGSATL